MKNGRHLEALAAVAVIMGALLVLFAVHSRRTELGARRAREARAERYASIAARELEGAVARDDAAEAEAVFDALAINAELRALAVLRADGSTLAVRGQLGAARTVRVTRGPAVVEVVESETLPVTSQTTRHATLVALTALVAGALWLVARGAAALRARAGRALKKVLPRP